PALHVESVALPADALRLAGGALELRVALRDLLPGTKRARHDFWRAIEAFADRRRNSAVGGEDRGHRPSRSDVFAPAPDDRRSARPVGRHDGERGVALHLQPEEDLSGLDPAHAGGTAAKS